MFSYNLYIQLQSSSLQSIFEKVSGFLSNLIYTCLLISHSTPVSVSFAISLYTSSKFPPSILHTCSALCLEHSSVPDGLAHPPYIQMFDQKSVSFSKSFSMTLRM